METITQDQLVKLASNIKGNTFVSIVAETDPRMRKTGNPYLGTVKHTVTGGQMNGADYERMVNRRGSQEGLEPSFTAQPRKWGSYVKDTGGKVVEHNGQFYLALRFRKNAMDVKTQFFFNGEKIERETIQPWLPKSYQPKTQSDYGLSEENQVVCRDFAFRNIREISIGGNHYRVV